MQLQHKAYPKSQQDGLYTKGTLVSRVSFVSRKNRKRRLLWVKERRNWSLDDCKKVAWSDEPRLLFHHANCKIRMWNKPDKSMDLLLAKDNSAWWRWNYSMGMISCSKESLDVCGHSSGRQRLTRHLCGSRALVYGNNFPLWRLSLSAGQSTLPSCSTRLGLFLRTSIRV